MGEEHHGRGPGAPRRAVSASGPASCLSPSQRQAGELLRKVAGFYSAFGRPVVAESEKALSSQLQNGSRVLALPGKEATPVVTPACAG